MSETNEKVEEVPKEENDLMDEVIDEMVEDLSEEDETTEEEPKEVQEVSLDDLDSVPDSEKFRKITPEEKVKVKQLTISEVKLGRPNLIDEKGEAVLPEVNAKGGKYYKTKLIVHFEETINGDRIREFVPSIFYSVDDNGNINPVPTIPKACPDEKLNDNFTNELSKLKNKYAKFVKKDMKDVSSSEFVKGLVGKKVKIETQSGEFKGKKWQKLKIVDFVN